LAVLAPAKARRACVVRALSRGSAHRVHGWPAEAVSGVSLESHAPWWRRMWQALLVALAVTAAGVTAAGVAVAEPETARSWSDRELGGWYWVDSTASASLKQARSAFGAGAGRPADPDEVMPLGPGTAVWFRLDLPPVAEPTRAVLRVAFSGTDSVELFRPAGPGIWQSQRSGDSVPVAAWPVRHIDPSFAFTIQPGEEATYLRVRNAQPIRVKLTLQNVTSFTESVKAWHFVLGAYAGFIAMVVLLSLFNAVSWRDPIHFYYAVHVVMVAVSITALTGLAGEYLWPANAWWNDKAPVVIPGLSVAWVGLFLHELVAERGRRLVSWLLLGHVASSVALVIAFLIVGRENVYRAPSLFALPGLLVLLGVMVWHTRRQPKVGLWILAGMACLMAGALAPLVHNLGLVEPSFVTEFGLQLGGAAEVPLLLVGLFFRSRERRANRQRLEALAHTDPLTGLANHRVLAHRLASQLRLARKDPLAGAVLRVHVANLPDIAAEYGREAGEAALMRAGECVAKEAHEGDLVAREQGNDIVLVLDGHPTQGQAAIAGRNIIARGLKYSGRLPPGVTLKLRIAGCSAPLPEGTDPAGLMQTLARLLLDIGNDPQGRALRFVGATDSSPWRSSPWSRPEDLPPQAPPSVDELLSVEHSRPRRATTTK